MIKEIIVVVLGISAFWSLIYFLDWAFKLVIDYHNSDKKNE